MAYLSVTCLSLDLSLGQEGAKELAQYLLQVTQTYSSTLYRQSSRVAIGHHSGSWKAVITILGSISLVFNQYGQFRSNIDWLIKDAKSVKEYLHETLVKEGLDAQRILEIKRRECTPDRIRRVFQRIERHKSKLLDIRPRGGLERDKELICNMIARIVREELTHEQDRIMFIQSLDEGFRSAAEGRLGVSPIPVEILWEGNRNLLPESELRGGLTLKPSSSLAVLEPREDFVFPYPPTIPKEPR